ncbi:MAG TPA: S8 family serine peptidase [Puia sp.]|nr:S8 family serine peptidase [Puia sp.]
MNRSIIDYWRVLVLTAVFALPIAGKAQDKDWKNEDLEKDTVFGISTTKAYGLLQGKKHRTVVVAVIDGGTDTAHEDLRDVLWVNPKEKPANGVDDDHDGYIDDVHGWDFIGGKDSDVWHDNLEMVRLLREEAPRYDSIKSVSISGPDSVGYARYLAMKKAYEQGLRRVEMTVNAIGRFKTIMDSMVIKMGKDSPTLGDWQAFQPQSGGEQRVREIMISSIQQGETYGSIVRDGIDAPLKHFEDELHYHYNMAYDPRPIVGDDYNDSRQRFYGNADVTGPDALHGTHVAGIIAAERGNGKGVDGVADDVRLMILRVVPDGDERDKDVANAIRFAADHGARVINMSFGKAYAKDKAAVDEAVKYALKKDVLLIQAAGNDGKDLDDSANPNFPNRIYADGSGVAGAWIVVGASGWKNDSNLVASFSNYGRRSVDVFAPGVQIYSCLPGSKYGFESGTSMASPVVTGLAALIREYHPKLRAQQVKDIILASVVKPGHPVYVGSGKDRRAVRMDELCVTGGVVNAYKALEMAAGKK